MQLGLLAAELADPGAADKALRKGLSWLAPGDLEGQDRALSAIMAVRRSQVRERPSVDLSNNRLKLSSE